MRGEENSITQTQPVFPPKIDYPEIDNLSKKNTEFSSGAVRSPDAEGYRYDLISVPAICTILKGYDEENTLITEVMQGIRRIYQFLDKPTKDSLPNLYNHAVLDISSAIKLSKDNNLNNLSNICNLAFAMKHLAATYHEGAIKYDSFNWEKGMPVWDLLNHALRHLFLFLEGDKSENHLSHALWNVFAAIHSFKEWPELNEGTLRKASPLQETPSTEPLD